MENLGPSTRKQFSSRCVIIDDSVIDELVNDSDLDEYEIEDNQNIEDRRDKFLNHRQGKKGNGKQPDKKLIHIYDGKKILQQ
jgi:hypothetical protein